MRHLCSRKIQALSSSRSPFLVLLLQEASSRLSRRCHTHSSSRRHEDESRNVRVSVWWDFENCNVPAGTKSFRIVHTITAAIRANGIKGPIEITAFGDMMQLSRDRQEGLCSTGINLTHVPRDGKNSTDRSLLLSLMFWVSQNPPPAHLLLISGDSDFSSTLHRLRMSNYNILLAVPTNAPVVLCSAASIMWNWHDMLRGDNLSGKYLNQPPDGPYGSWYGHYEAPLLDPFSEVDQQACLSSNVSLVPIPCEQPGQVKKRVVKRIREILEENPKGVAILDLHKELSKDFKLDRKYYGHRRFLPFLLSLRKLVKLKLASDGYFIAYPVSRKDSVDSESSSDVDKRLHDSNEDEDVNAVSELSHDKKCVKDSADNGASLPMFLEQLPSSLSSDVNKNEGLENTQKTSALDENMIKMDNASTGDFPTRDGNIFETARVDEKLAETVDSPESGNHFPPLNEKIVETICAPEADSPVPVVVEQDSSHMDGILRKFWRKWVGSKSSGSDNKSSEDEKKCEGNDMETDSKSKVGHVKTELISPHSSNLSESAEENIIFTNSEASLDKPVNPGFLCRIRNLFKFSNATSAADKLGDCSSDPSNPITEDPSDKLFLKDSFWSSMESFLNAPQGSLIVSESKTREQMAHSFRSKGPVCLQSLGENDVLRLVNLLISEKKWVEESPSEDFPFKLSQGEKSLSSVCPHGSNGLSSSDSMSQSSALRLANHDTEGKSENVSEPVEEDLQVRSRDEVLADCQNLLNEMLKKHPEGFFVGVLKKYFLERYGYRLDFQKLGFRNVSAMIRTLPGMKVESGYIVPCDNNPPNTAMVENTSRYEKSHIGASDILVSPDALWEELGPVASEKSPEKETDFEFEPAISDDESSDSAETSPSGKADGHFEALKEEESGSLLDILDSWHTRKSGDNCKAQSEDADTVPDSTKSSSRLSLSQTMRAMPPRMNHRKQKPQKTISFVSETSSDDNDDKLVNGGILGSLRKSPNGSPKKAKDKVLFE